MSKSKWFVYMVRCSDETLYTGITTDLDRRLTEHNGLGTGKDKGSKYTRVRRPVELVYQTRCSDKSAAATKEAAWKKLTKSEKEKLIRS